MAILLDECVPRPLKRELRDYEIRIVVEMRWSGIKNGQLLQLMSQQGFTILLITDQNLRYSSTQESLPSGVRSEMLATSRFHVFRMS